MSTKPVTLVLDARIGPDSPKIVFKYNSCNDVKKSLWDPYCHYERQTYKEFGLRSDRSEVNIEVCEDPPDYASCVNKEFDFDGFLSQEKYICTKDLFLIGGNIESIEFR